MLQKQFQIYSNFYKPVARNPLPGTRNPKLGTRNQQNIWATGRSPIINSKQPHGKITV